MEQTMPEKLDKETQEIYNEGERLSNFVASEDWQRVKAKLVAKINKLTDIRSIPTEGLSKEQVADEMDRRIGAASLVEEWLEEIEGIVQTHTQQTEKFVKDTKGFIRHYE